MELRGWPSASPACLYAVRSPREGALPRGGRKRVHLDWCPAEDAALETNRKANSQLLQVNPAGRVGSCRRSVLATYRHGRGGGQNELKVPAVWPCPETEGTSWCWVRPGALCGVLVHRPCLKPRSPSRFADNASGPTQSSSSSSISRLTASSAWRNGPRGVGVCASCLS